MRQIINRDPVQAHRAISMKAATRSLEEMLELIPCEDAEQVSTFQGQVYMPESFLEKYLLPTMQIRKYLENEEETSESGPTLPGGIETAAMMYSMFNQTNVAGDAESNRKLRALIAHAVEQTPQLIDQIGQNIRSKTRSLELYVSQLREVAQRPPLRTLYGMSTEDIADKNRLINDVLTHFESQLSRDYTAYERERQKNVLIAKLNYDQQSHILDVNNHDYMKISNQRQEIIEKTSGLGVQIKVSQIKDTLIALQEELAQQCQSLNQVLGPLDTTRVMETLAKLRDALKDATYQNAHLVIANNELTLENSFMTPNQKREIQRIKAEQSPLYMNQRVTPHYIENSAVGINIFKTAVNTLPPWTTFLSTEDILKEVDEVLRTKGNKIELNTQLATILPITRGKGKRTGDTHLRPGDTKYPRLDTQVGSSSEPPTVTQGNHSYKPDLSGMSKGQQKGYYSTKGNGKSKPYLGSRYAPSNVPTLNSGTKLEFYFIRDLEHPGTATCSYNTVAYKLPTANRFMHEPLTALPPIKWLQPQMDVPPGTINQGHKEIYRHALECMRQAIQSPLNRVIQDRDTRFRRSLRTSTRPAQACDQVCTTCRVT
jgi:hypothetical protein